MGSRKNFLRKRIGIRVCYICDSWHVSRRKAFQSGLRNKVNSANQVVAISSRHYLHLITSLQNNLHKQLRSSWTRKPSYQLIMPHICMSIYRVYNIRCFVTLLRCIRFTRLFAPATLSLQFLKNLSASHLLYCYRKRTLRISSKWIRGFSWIINRKR